jgi:glutathione S-transferase
MILIGQYDSPFVRRVGVALRLYGMPFEHRPWSVWGNAEELARYNPLRRVPVLVLDDGQALLESAAILDALDDLVGPEQALLPRGGPLRRDGLRLAALATGLADKGVTLLYEHVLRKEDRRSEVWVTRCQAQLRDTLAVLEGERKGRPGPYLLGERLTHPDVALACALRFLAEAHPTFVRLAEWPALAAHAARCEAIPDMQEIAQPLLVQLD